MLLCVNPSFEQNYITPLLANEQLPYIKLLKSVPWHSEICEEIRAIYEKLNLPEAPLLIQTHFFQIWAKLFSNVSGDEHPSKDSGNLTIIKAMVGYIQKDYRENLTLAKIAASGSVGQSKCCKLFKNYLNLTPNAYLNQCRLDKSRELLRDTELSITDISEAVGYDGASYFSEVFRKWYNISPSEYRMINRSK
ncbi:MAG: hypothetical protein K0S41_2001 [Anaerocolumna sp.]|jgi:AraC-like DNA-binding protein|nr:hypothetical protein [Anaerocolumna sp.]